MLRTLRWHLTGQVSEGTRQGGVFRLDADYEFVRVSLYAGTAPTGSNLRVDINADGTSLFTLNNKPGLVIGATEDSYDVIDNTVTVLTDGTVISLDVDAVGNGEPGRDVTVQMDLEEVSSSDN